MNLFFSKYAIEVCLAEDLIQVIAIENSAALAEFVHHLWVQANGKDGDVILSDAEGIYNLDKKMSVIINPFAISCNDRKIINKLYKDMQNIVIELHYEEYQKLNSSVIEFLDIITGDIPYGLGFDLETDLQGLFKLYSVSLDDNADTFLDRLVNFCKVMHRICFVNYFAFVNLRQFLSVDELTLFYDFIRKEHLSLLIVEGQFLGRKTADETLLIIDKDLCIINSK